MFVSGFSSISSSISLLYKLYTLLKKLLQWQWQSKIFIDRVMVLNNLTNKCLSENCWRLIRRNGNLYYIKLLSNCLSGLYFVEFQEFWKCLLVFFYLFITNLWLPHTHILMQIRKYDTIRILINVVDRKRYTLDII